MGENIADLDSLFNRFPVLSTKSLVLREITELDSERYMEILNHPEVACFLSDEDVPQSHYQAVKEVRFWSGLFYKRQSLFWGIAEKQTNRLIGNIGFNYWNQANHCAEISYELDRALWRRGIMTEALKAVLQFSFYNMGLHRIEAKTMLHNTASAALLKKLGFKHEGTLKSYRLVRGNLIDVDIYSLGK